MSAPAWPPRLYDPAHRRAVNTSLARHAAPGDGTRLHFFCECPRTVCRELLELTADEYLARAAAGPVAAAHAAA